MKGEGYERTREESRKKKEHMEGPGKLAAAALMPAGLSGLYTCLLYTSHLKIRSCLLVWGSSSMQTELKRISKNQRTEF